MIEINHLNRQRKNYRRQLEHDRAAQSATLRGEKTPEWSLHDELNEDNEMGDTFSIAGDTVHHHYPAAQQQQTTTNKAFGIGKAALIAAGLLGSGALGTGVPWMLGAYDKESTTTTIHESQDMGVGVEVIPGGALD